MLFKRWYHSTVGMGNKMFVVGGSFGLIQFPSIHCEVYDSVSQTFDYLETFREGYWLCRATTDLLLWK